MPAYERHLLFCTDPVLRPGADPEATDAADLDAVNRVLAVFDESVDELLPRPTAAFRPTAGAA